MPTSPATTTPVGWVPGPRREPPEDTSTEDLISLLKSLEPEDPLDRKSVV